MAEAITATMGEQWVRLLEDPRVTRVAFVAVTDADVRLTVHAHIGRSPIPHAFQYRGTFAAVLAASLAELTSD